MASSKENKILILIVDRDNDIGLKTNIKSPIIGREENLKAATQLAIADPEEADANTIFAAIKMFDELKAKYGENIEIASVTGLPEEGLEADHKIVNELSKVLEKFPATSCIFVSDGVTDQEVIPIISSKIPIMHVKRIVIRHSESVEETWALLSRYLKKAVFEQKYSRILLGIPGIIFLIIGLLMLSGLGYLVFPALIALAGLLMFIRGFNIDSAIESFIKKLIFYATTTAANQIRLFTYISSFLIIMVALYLGIGSIINKVSSILIEVPIEKIDLWFWASNVPLFLGIFINRSIDVLIIGIYLLIIGNGIFYYFVRDKNFWKMIQAAIVNIWIWVLLKRVAFIFEYGESLIPIESQIIGLILTTIIGVITITISIISLRFLRRKYLHIFKKAK